MSMLDLVQYESLVSVKCGEKFDEKFWLLELLTYGSMFVNIRDLQMRGSC